MEGVRLAGWVGEQQGVCHGAAAAMSGGGGRPVGGCPDAAVECWSGLSEVVGGASVDRLRSRHLAMHELGRALVQHTQADLLPLGHH